MGYVNILRCLETYLRVEIASYGGPSRLATKLHDAGVNWSAEGDLSFLNEWFVISLGLGPY